VRFPSGEVDIPSNDALSPSSITLDAWVNPSTLSAAAQCNFKSVVAKYDNSPSTVSWIFGMLGGGQLNFAVYGGPNIYQQIETNDPVLVAGVWQHVAATFDSSTQAIHIYVNGVDEPSTLQPGSSPVTSLQQYNGLERIGATNAGCGPSLTLWPGLIDEVQIFSRALSASEILAIYKAGSGGQCKGNAVDISYSAGVVSNDVWTQLRESGKQFVAVDAWMGYHGNPDADLQLSGAQNNFLGTAAYVLLNYDKPNQSGHYQVNQALLEIGTAINQLSLLIIDVEPINGESLPQTPTAIKQRIGRISGAVSAAQATGKKVAIYTDRGSWKEITGNCSASGQYRCPALVALPLWDVEHKPYTGPDNMKHCGDDIFGLGNFKPYPPSGWQTRSGNQYDYSDPSSGCNGTTLFGIPVDLDFFDPALFQ
jgi:hypothetical protein